MKRIKLFFGVLMLLIPVSGMAQWVNTVKYSEGLAFVKNDKGKYGFID